MVSLATLSVVLLFWTIITIETTDESPTSKLLYEAAQRGDLTSVKQMAGDACAYVNDTYEHYAIESNWTPLHVASARNHADVVIFLLSCNADPNIQTLPHEKSPLMMAARHAEVSVTNALLTANPDIDALNRDQMTALMIASAYWNPDTVKALIAAGAKIDLQMQLGMTALMMATGKTNVDAVKALIAAGAQLDLQDNEGKTALMHASIYRDKDAAKALRRLGRQEESFDTLLHEATSAHLDLTNTLLDHGANVNIQDHENNTALHWAAEKNRTEQVAALLQHGANSNIKSNSSETAADVARNNGFTNILQMIEQYSDTGVINGPPSGNEVPTSKSQYIVPALMLWGTFEVVNFLVMSLIAG